MSEVLAAFSPSPPPNRAGHFHGTRLSSLLVFLNFGRWLTLASVLENGEDRFGGAHLAYLGVLSMGDLLPSADGLRAPFRCARGDGLPVR